MQSGSNLTPKRALGGYWVNGKAVIRGLCLRAPRTTEFVRKYTMQVSSNWISSLKVKLSLLRDKLVVGLSPGGKITKETHVPA